MQATGMHDSEQFRLRGSHASWPLQERTTYVSEYTAPATLITESCKVASNTTDGWTQTLWSGGVPTVYPSRTAFLDAMATGSATSIWTPLVGC